MRVAVPRHVVVLALALGSIFAGFWAGIGTRDLPGDLILYFDYANHVDDGHVPYRDFTLEYPPLALVPILLPFTFGQSFGGFEAAFALEMWALAVPGGVLVWSLLGRVLPGATPGERRWRLAAYVACFPLLGQIVTTRFDLAPTVLAVGALALWLRRTPTSERAAWAVLAAGVATKLFPGVLAPLLVLDLLARRGWRAAVGGGAQLLAWTALFVLPGLLASPSGLTHALRYHSQRGVQLESSYANGLLLLNRITGFAVGSDNVFGAFEAISAWTDELKVISFVVQLAALALVYGWWIIALRRRPMDTLTRDRQIVLFATLALAVFIVTGKVFSPQYLIWLMPLIVLIPGNAGQRAIGWFLATLLLTQLIFPYGYDHLIARDALGITLLTARNTTLFICLWLLVRAITAEQPHHRESRPPEGNRSHSRQRA